MVFGTCCATVNKAGLLIYIFISATFGCTDEDSAGNACTTARIMFGTEVPMAFSLAPGQQRAVAIIIYPDGDACTGTLVAPGAILTAAHCIRGGRSPEIVFGTADDKIIKRLWPTDVDVHSELDLAILRVDGAEVPGSITPLPVIGQELDGSWLGSMVEIGGFGITENGSAYAKRFAATLVEELDEDSIVVSSNGANGACVGDSGGPVFGRDNLGRIGVIGVLTAGHPSCIAQDRYVRVDAAQQWWRDNSIPTSVEADGCDGLTVVGGCVREHAMRCKEHQPVVEHCKASEGLTCGRLGGDEFFHCVPIHKDVCGGLGSARICEGDAIVACGANGPEEELDCNRCAGDLSCQEQLPGLLATCDVGG